MNIILILTGRRQQIAQYALEFNSGKIKSLGTDGKITMVRDQRVEAKTMSEAPS
jgi:hypothetical protein